VVSFTLWSLLVVAVLIKLEAGRPNNRCLIAGSGKTIFSSSKHPDTLWAHLEFYPLEPGGVFLLGLKTIRLIRADFHTAEATVVLFSSYSN
jgi:hypothetical protein